MVAALGDSITAGVGARANSVLDIFTEYRFFSRHMKRIEVFFLDTLKEYRLFSLCFNVM